MKLLEWCLVALLNAVSCDHDWCAHVEREYFEGCWYIDIEVWRYQQAWTGMQLEYPTCP